MSESTFPIGHSAERYSQWLARQRAHDLLPKEHLIPTLKVETPRTLPGLMRSRWDITDEEKAALQAELNRHYIWGYSIQLTDGILTAAADELEKMVYRAHLIGGAVKQLAGENLDQMSVTDLACNHAYFAMHCIYEGAKSAYGCDLREANVDKSMILLKHFGVDNVTIEQRNAYDVSEPADVVLNLGLLYHVTDPYKLMKKTYDLTQNFAVIDTITHLAPVAAFIQRVNKHSNFFPEGEFEVEYHPTYRALIDLMHAVGFRNLMELTPVDRPGRARHPLYERFQRRAIVGFK
ncbi:MAG: methyltransferase domain-containing protein [Pseudomonadota bacterium]